MGGTNWIVQDIDYDGWNQPSVIHLGQGPDQSLYLSNDYQEATGRLTRTLATTSLSQTVVSDHHYSYDAAGNPLKDEDRANGDAQCYTYDDHQRLAAAWTPADANCATDPATALLGGPSPYRQSWTYTGNGLRKTQTSHLPAVGTTPASEVTDTYTYPAAGSAHANFPTKVTRTNTADGAVVETNPYAVDDAGNTVTRPGVAAGTTQDLTWNSDGDLASLTVKGEGPDKATTYVYGADGTLLVKDSPSEKTMMAFGLEITVDKTASPWVTSAARHYDTPVGQVAVRHSDGSLDFQIPDAHGTAQTSLDAASLTATRRYLTPFGEDRVRITGSYPGEDAWPTSRGFLNKFEDADTGLTSVGARDYDPTLGRFLSVDPILDTTDPHQALGYTYANNNPVTFSDPTGLYAVGPDGTQYPHQTPGADGECRNPGPCGGYVPGTDGGSRTGSAGGGSGSGSGGPTRSGSRSVGTGGSSSVPQQSSGPSQAELERMWAEKRRIQRQKERAAMTQASLNRLASEISIIAASNNNVGPSGSEDLRFSDWCGFAPGDAMSEACVDGMGTINSRLEEIPGWHNPVEYQWGKGAASIFNIGYGVYKFKRGKFLIKATPLCGYLGGITAARVCYGFGVKDVTLGGLRSIRGVKQGFEVGVDRGKCYANCTVGGQAKQGAFNVLPKAPDLSEGVVGWVIGIGGGL